MIIALDLDGTLLTCAPRHCAVARYSLGCVIRGAPIKFDASRFWNQKRNGLTTHQCMSFISQDAANAAAEIWLDQIENVHWLGMDSMIRGARDALLEMLHHGKTLALVSARRDPAAARLQIERLGVADLFESVHFVSPRNAREAKASVLRKLAASLYIGDTELDFAAAAAADVPCRLVDTGSRCSAYLESNLPVVTFPSTLEAFRDGLDY